MIIAKAGKTVLPPMIGARAGLIVAEITPRIAVLAVVLAHRAPLALADVRSPPVPLARLEQTVLQPAEPRYPIPFRTHGRPLSPRCTAALVIRPRPAALIANTEITAGPNAFLTARKDKLITYHG